MSKARARATFGGKHETHQGSNRRRDHGATVQAQESVAPMRIVVGFGAGGVTDVLARIFAEEFRKRLGRVVLVENRPGCVYRKPHPAIILDLVGKIPCSCARIPCSAEIIPCSVL
jgi:hypothetical protein